MEPLFGFPLDDSENPPPSRKQATRGIVAGGIVAMVIGLLLALGSSSINAVGVFSIGIMVIVVILTLVGLAVVNSRRGEPEKGKRGVDGQDMFTLIDRMVDDLDDDEVDYLRSRLEQREHGSKNELADSLGELLEQRTEARRRGER